MRTRKTTVFRESGEAAFNGLYANRRAPLLLPIVQGVGMDPIHFAAVLGVNLGMANITPPTTPLLYLGSQVTATPVNEMLKPTLILIVFAWLPTLMLTTFIPELALFLPELLLG
ncbi:TRAP transporter large permease subunit [Halomonas denitrificans]|uniref:TRAP transporter large permease subunit n=1 Tax=Halomonas denitrificans TaxID=370769 RepID=UPI001FEB031B|nr:TRAP transporter large permease subunit [Halomonas denitrificans]